MIEFVIFVAIAASLGYALNRWVFVKSVPPNITQGGGAPPETHPEDPREK